jgi:putative Holliday junction resolvase
LDIGEKRTGVAVSDIYAKIATPVSVIATSDMLSGCPAFKRLLEDYEPATLLVGLPVSLDGSEHAQAARVREIANRLAQATGLPLQFADERLSSAQAKKAMREMGYNERTMRGKLDMIAAALFLQTYLDQAKECLQHHE